MYKPRNAQFSQIAGMALAQLRRPELAEDVLHAGCLKATCPGRHQLATCQLMRSALQCSGGQGTQQSGRQTPRTSLSQWWLR